MREIVEQLRQEIQKRELSASQAASEIGTTVVSLRRHLDGNYVRSDSAAKYRRWLSGEWPTRSDREEPQESEQVEVPRIGPPKLVDVPPAGVEPFRVVDLFSGSGGLSLGFELDSSRSFDVTLAIEIEQPLVDNFNANAGKHSGRAPCVCADLSDFVNEAEILAFYLDHLTAEPGQDELRKALQRLPSGPLSRLQREVAQADAWFLQRFREIGPVGKQPSAPDVPGDALRQTSVVGFHRSLGLPVSSSSAASLPPFVWRGTDDAEPLLPKHPGTSSSDLRETFERLWAMELQNLRQRSEVRPGKGQLASSARRIGQFVEFVDRGGLDEVREVWLAWRSVRHSLRIRAFADPETLLCLRQLYGDGRQAKVILGGPPCQGFSRIGRGKIRSLREDGVQVHVDGESGDLRNKLLHGYVQFVSALSPDVFLFENVRHFKSLVKTPDGEFDAPGILAEAIHEISTDHLQYAVSHRIVDASEHNVPQTRERYIMCGVREGAVATGFDPAAWILDLPRTGAVPLKTALAGLGEAKLVGGSGKVRTVLSETTAVGKAAASSAEGQTFLDWVSVARDGQAGSTGRVEHTDAHHARAPRGDDAAWFRLMAPGTRWMDYRSDSAPTLARIVDLLDGIEEKLSSVDLPDPALCEETKAVKELIDGSLPLRLMLEQIGALPGEERHHLAVPTYLRKRDGNHGDWLARLDGERPCKTIVSHMAKDTYAYVHPSLPRTLSVREAARVQTFPDWFSFGSLSLVDAFKAVGNAVPPLLAAQMASRVAQVLWYSVEREGQTEPTAGEPRALAAAAG
jgi:site-specific DNA-cytosine methylase